MIAFHETGYGRRFFDGQLPALIKNLGRIAEALERGNKRRAESAARSNDVESLLAGLKEAVSMSADNKLNVLKCISGELDEADYWQATVLYSEGGSEGTWGRFYLKAADKEDVEAHLRREHKHSTDFFVERVDYEIDPDFNMVDLTEDR